MICGALAADVEDETEYFKAMCPDSVLESLNIANKEIVQLIAEHEP